MDSSNGSTWSQILRMAPDNLIYAEMRRRFRSKSQEPGDNLDHSDEQKIEVLCLPASAQQPQKRRLNWEHTPWPGWKVAKMGKHEGYELVNIGGGLEWAQISVGAVLQTHQDNKFWEFRVVPGVHPCAWKEVEWSPAIEPKLPATPKSAENIMQDEESDASDASNGDLAQRMGFNFVKQSLALAAKDTQENSSDTL